MYENVERIGAYVHFIVRSDALEILKTRAPMASCKRSQASP